MKEAKEYKEIIERKANCRLYRVTLEILGNLTHDEKQEIA
jgi:hypothetical protein